MLHVIASLALIALGMGLDALYQREIRIAECNAYETGYRQGKKEERIREEGYCGGLWTPSAEPAQEPIQNNPSMAAPVEMPDTFAEHLKKHGQVTMWMKKGGRRYEFGCKEHH